MKTSKLGYALALDELLLGVNTALGALELADHSDPAVVKVVTDLEYSIERVAKMLELHKDE